jgi:hypothetical protein
VRVVRNERVGGKTAADVPEGSGERAAGFALCPLPPEKPDQPLSRLRKVPVEDQIGK